MSPEDESKVQEFMENYMLDLTYDIVTKKIALSDLVNTDDEVILSYDPFAIGEIDQAWLLQDLMDYYIETEEYEKCAKLLAMKIKVENGLLDLSDRLYLTDEHFEEYDSTMDDLLKDFKDNKQNKN
tara:strand:+ start:10492 stop:10869 length:378 start_codon:yes stop_codon:yes gene_type:complete